MIKYRQNTDVAVPPMTYMDNQQESENKYQEDMNLRSYFIPGICFRFLLVIFQKFKFVSLSAIQIPANRLH